MSLSRVVHPLSWNMGTTAGRLWVFVLTFFLYIWLSGAALAAADGDAVNDDGVPVRQRS